MQLVTTITLYSFLELPGSSQVKALDSMARILNKKKEFLPDHMLAEHVLSCLFTEDGSVVPPDVVRSILESNGET